MLEALADSSLGLPLTLAGALCSLAPLVIVALLHRSRLAALAQLTALVGEGQAHEARVLARSGGAAMRPLLDALSGASDRPASPLPIRELLLAAVALIPPFVVPLYGFGALERAPAAETVPGIAGLLAGAAILIPLSAICAAVIVHLGIRGSRAVRSAGIAILAQQARAAPAEGRARREDRGTGEVARAKLREETR